MRFDPPPVDKSTYCAYYLECRLIETTYHIRNLTDKKVKDSGELELLDKLNSSVPKILENYEFACVLDYQRFLCFIAKERILVEIFRDRRKQKESEPTIEPAPKMRTI